MLVSLSANGTVSPHILFLANHSSVNQSKEGLKKSETLLISSSIVNSLSRAFNSFPPTSYHHLSPLQTAHLYPVPYQLLAFPSVPCQILRCITYSLSVSAFFCLSVCLSYYYYLPVASLLLNSVHFSPLPVLFSH